VEYVTHNTWHTLALSFLPMPCVSLQNQHVCLHFEIIVVHSWMLESILLMTVHVWLLRSLSVAVLQLPSFVHCDKKGAKCFGSVLSVRFLFISLCLSFRFELFEGKLSLLSWGGVVCYLELSFVWFECCYILSCLWSHIWNMKVVLVKSQCL
jgi:hypothetical protein